MPISRSGNVFERGCPPGQVRSPLGGCMVASPPPGPTVNPPPAAGFGLGDIIPAIGTIIDILPIPGGGIIGDIIDTLVPGATGGTTGGTACIPPYFLNDRTGRCELDLIPGAGMGGTGGQRTGEFGDAVGGQFGVGLVPAQRPSSTSICPRGSVLGKDGLCYNKRGFPNSQRKWPKGRAPLLTGGERNAITKASRAARKIERTTKQLQRLGMIKKPSRRRAAAPRQVRAIAPGTSIVNVE